MVKYIFEKNILILAVSEIYDIFNINKNRNVDL